MIFKPQLEDMFLAKNVLFSLELSFSQYFSKPSFPAWSRDDIQ
jgi:hypothetical protein